MLLAGTPDGVYRVPTQPFDEAEQVLDGVSVRALERRHNSVVAATDAGLFETDDGGETWQDCNLPVANVHSVHLSEAGVYAGVEPAAIYRAERAGDSWTRLAGFDAVADDAPWPTNPHREDAWVRDVASPPGDSDTLFAGVEVGGLVASTDGGASWHELDAVPDDVHDILPITPQRWVVSCGVGGPERTGGVFETTDAGETWAERDLGPYEYVRESCYKDRLYTAGNTSGPLWTPPDAALFVDDGGGLERVSYPGEPDSFVISWGVEGEAVLAGTNDGTILCGPGDWAAIGTVPVSESDQQAWGVRSLVTVAP
jgi:hypothetical protein